VSDDRQMQQTAPYPDVLASLVRRLRYRQDLGWEVQLADDLQRDKPGRHSGESRGLTLVVTRCGRDTYHTDKILPVNHYFAVPPATYNEASWMRWLFDRLGDVDTHERMEDFAFKRFCEPPDELVAWQAEGGELHEMYERPFAPQHGPGNDPYRVCEYATDTDRRTSFRGDLNPQ
jgi:hypothetical protein